MDLEQKLFPVKALSEEGSLQAVISTFDQVDRDGDVMLAAAFNSSNGKAIPMVWSHDWEHPVGRGTVSVTGQQAVFSGQFFMDTDKGVQAYRTVKAMGDLQQYSIGFRVLDSSWDIQDDGKGGQSYIRTIKDIELFEASPVLVGAAYGTRTLAVKELKSTWDAAYVDNLPDSAFAIVLPGGTKDAEGKTTPRDLRKLPHHDEGGAVDDPHLRNALSREPQTDMSAAEHERAKAHLDRHAAAEGIGTDNTGKALASVLVQLDHLEKAGATLSAANLGHLHNAMRQMMSLHNASNCDMGQDCPMYQDGSKSYDPYASVSPERAKTLQEIDARLARA